MKLKTFLLLILLVIASFINNYEYSKESKSNFMLKEKSKNNFSKKSNSKTLRTSYHKSRNYSNRSLALMKSRTKELTTILFSISLVLKVANAAVVKFVQLELKKTLDYLNKEKSSNIKTISTLREISINGCSQIKLIMEINKNFFIQSQFQTILLSSYKYIKEHILKEEPINNYLYKTDVPLVLNEYLVIRKKISNLSNNVNESFKEIEGKLCGDNLRVKVFIERNKGIDKEIKLINE